MADFPAFVVAAFNLRFRSGRNLSYVRAMAESPVIALAARILRQVADGTPADLALREALKRTPQRSAPAERRDVSRAVFTYFRWVRWLEQRESPAKQLEAALLLQDRFNRDPSLFKGEALAARAVPDWAAAEIDWPESAGIAGADSSGSIRPFPTELEWLRQLQREPVLWIRAKAGLEGKVAQSLGHCVPATTSIAPTPSAWRYTGATDLFYSESFQAGEFEIQDLASQFVSIACAPRAGETWWDACAGEGGKTLHLADLMENKGMIWASDRSARRLAKLKERAARAKVFNYRAAPWQGDSRLPTKAKFDGILVDAPCSGVGTWQRNPHARWSTQMHDVQELAQVQGQLLHEVAGSLKPGGRLVYAVCTLARSETSAVAARFTETHSDYSPDPLRALGSEQGSLVLQPSQLNANGMFVAAWRRK